MGFESIVAFWVVSILVVLTPGADWAYAITAGLSHRSVLPAVSGLLLGHLTATIIVAAGVGALVASQPVALAILTVVGAMYLVWMGAMTFLHPSAPAADDEQSPTSWVRQVVKGFGVSGLNPKVFLLFLALLPQFTDIDARWPLALQIVVLGLVHTASCAVVYSGVAIGARKILHARPRAARIVSRVSGGAMVTIGLALLLEQALG